MLHVMPQPMHPQLCAHLKPGPSIFTPSGSAGVAPLHLAAREGRADLVELLLFKGAAVDGLDGHGWTPLQARRRLSACWDVPARVHACLCMCTCSLAAAEGGASMLSAPLTPGHADAALSHATRPTPSLLASLCPLQVSRKFEQSDAEGVLLRAGAHDPGALPLQERTYVCTRGAGLRDRQRFSGQAGGFGPGSDLAGRRVGSGQDTGLLPAAVRPLSLLPSWLKGCSHDVNCLGIMRSPLPLQSPRFSPEDIPLSPPTDKGKSILDKPAASFPVPEPLTNGTKPATPATAAAVAPASASVGSAPLSDAGSQDAYIDSVASGEPDLVAAGGPSMTGAADGTSVGESATGGPGQQRSAES